MFLPEPSSPSVALLRSSPDGFRIGWSVLLWLWLVRSVASPVTSSSCRDVPGFWISVPVVPWFCAARPVAVAVPPMVSLDEPFTPELDPVVSFSRFSLLFGSFSFGIDRIAPKCTKRSFSKRPLVQIVCSRICVNVCREQYEYYLEILTVL